MKNRELKREETPTAAELYALERAAKVARSREMARLARALAGRVKTLFAATDEAKGLTHA